MDNLQLKKILSSDISPAFEIFDCDVRIIHGSGGYEEFLDPMAMDTDKELMEISYILKDANRCSNFELRALVLTDFNISLHQHLETTREPTKQGQEIQANLQLCKDQKLTLKDLLARFSTKPTEWDFKLQRPMLSWEEYTVLEFH
ncbi:hypothetical protein ACH5RR_014707 [Cinchona calisaya]|uniref:Uncharacterized protein n=1 Tax=Cinchona calisaya TaxID=153742 RepID=A0ABD2ZS85_9GENT